MPPFPSGTTSASNDWTLYAAEIGAACGATGAAGGATGAAAGGATIAGVGICGNAVIVVWLPSTAFLPESGSLLTAAGVGAND